jgi:hypothetical protein
MGIYLRNITWFFILFIGFEALGLREQGASGLGNQSAGVYSILQLIFLLVLFVSPVIYLTYFSQIRISDHLSLSIHLLFLFFIAELALNIISSGGYPLPKLLYNFYSLKYYLVFFFIMTWYPDIDSLKQLMKGTGIAALAAALVFLVFVFVYEFPSVIMKVTSDQMGRELRYLVPMGMLITFGLCFQLAAIVYKGFTWGRVLTGGVLLLAVYMQLHRNVHLGLLIILFMVVHKIFLSKQDKWIRWGVYSIIALAFFLFVKDILDNSESIIAQSVEEVTTDGGGIGIRVAVLVNSFNYVMANAPVTGIGFVWQDFDIYTIIQELFVLAPTNDNAYTNVLLCFGIAGVLLFGYLIFSMFRTIGKLRKTADKDVQVMRYTIQLSLVFILVSGFGSDNFIAYNSVIVFVILIGVLNRLKQIVHDRPVS